MGISNNAFYKGIARRSGKATDAPIFEPRVRLKNPFRKSMIVE